MKKDRSVPILIIYSLLTIIPLLVCAYIMAKYFTFYKIIPMENLFLIFSLIFILSILGIWILRNLWRNVEIILVQAKKLASGERVETIEIGEAEGGIKTLAMSLNSIVRRIESESLSLQDVSFKLENAYKELTGQKEYTERIINNMADTLLVIDIEAKIKMVNFALLELLGYKEEELFGKSVKSIVDEEKFSFSKNIMRPLLEKGSIRNQDIFYLTRNGVKIPMSFSGSLLKDEKNNVTGIVGIARDVRELKKLLLDLENANKELERLSKVKSIFISNASHELRTPLSTAKEAISQILEGIKGDISTQQRDFLLIASRNIDRLIYLIDNLLDLSRIEAGKVRIRRRLTSIPQLIEDVIPSFRQKVEQRPLKIKSEISSDLPLVYIDSDKITQVLTNLIDNSFKFTKDGEIDILTERKKDKIEISVVDTGIGIPPEHISGIFDRFQRFTYSHLPKESGLGLGLSIAKEIVEMHKGKIFVESPPSSLSHGSKFTFTLPIYTEEEYFHECLSDGITYVKDEKIDLSIVILQIKDHLPLTDFEKITKDIALRPTDFILKYKGNLIVLAFTDKNGASVVGKRIKEVLEKYSIFCDMKIVTYPSDVQTEEELFQLCEEGSEI